MGPDSKLCQRSCCMHDESDKSALCHAAGTTVIQCISFNNTLAVLHLLDADASRFARLGVIEEMLMAILTVARDNGHAQAAPK